MTICVCGKKEIEEGYVLNALLYKNDKSVWVCSDCPPQPCFNCGEPDSWNEPCSCTFSLKGVNLADLKAIFAKDELSVGGEQNDRH